MHTIENGKLVVDREELMGLREIVQNHGELFDWELRKEVDVARTHLRQANEERDALKRENEELRRTQETQYITFYSPTQGQGVCILPDGSNRIMTNPEAESFADERGWKMAYFAGRIRYEQAANGGEVQ